MVNGRIMGLCGVLLAALFFTADVKGMADKTNQGRWNKPTVNNLPDKEVPGFLVNLGPTGARAILTEKTFIVKYIFKDSPAVSRLKIDDEITGVFGKPFSPHHFGGNPHGYEGPIMDFGNAIEKAEGKDGKLVLNVTRDSKSIDVTVDLEPIGEFSPTFPTNCKKSEVVRAKALKYLAEHPDALNVWQSHAKMAVALALLTSDDPKQFAAGKAIILKWNGWKPGDGTWSWDLAHPLIALSEYHLLTKDASVLPTIKILVSALEKAQYKGNIVVWKAKESEDPAKVDAAQQLYDGGFGHAPYMAGVGKNGYGPMQYTTILAVIGWQLAGRCGVDAGPDYIKRSLSFIHRGTNAAGYVAYGGEFTLNNGIIDPVAWKKSKGGDDYVGRSGASLIAHKLSPEFSDSATYLESNRNYMKHAYKSLPDGHADANLGILWGLLGAGSSEDDALFRKTLDYHKAFINMMRCYDGSFVLLPGRNYADDGYYMASRYHPTATMALVLGLGNPKLLIQGIQVNVPGVNPKALKGNLDVAYKAIVKKSYAEAATALKNAKGEDSAAVEAMNSLLDASAQKEIDALAVLEKSGDIYQLQKALEKLKISFGPLESIHEKTKHYEEELQKDPWKMESQIGANYYQLADALKRNKSVAYAIDLERFAARHPDSFYGARALEMSKQFRDSMPVVTKPVADQAQAKPIVSASAVAPLAVSAEALEQWQARLVKRLDSLAKGGMKIKFSMGSEENYYITGASEKSLSITMGATTLPMSWKQLTVGARTILAKEILKEDDVETMLIAAVFMLANGENNESDDLFAKAYLKDADAVKSAKATLTSHL